MTINLLQTIIDGLLMFISLGRVYLMPSAKKVVFKKKFFASKHAKNLVPLHCTVGISACWYVLFIEKLITLPADKCLFLSLIFTTSGILIFFVIDQLTEQLNIHFMSINLVMLSLPMILCLFLTINIYRLKLHIDLIHVQYALAASWITFAVLVTLRSIKEIRLFFDSYQILSEAEKTILIFDQCSGQPFGEKTVTSLEYLRTQIKGLYVGFYELDKLDMAQIEVCVKFLELTLRQTEKQP